VSLHKFPDDPTLSKEWLKRIGRPQLVPNDYTKICSLHFLPSDFIHSKSTQGSHKGQPRHQLKKDAIPMPDIQRLVTKVLHMEEIAPNAELVSPLVVIEHSTIGSFHDLKKGCMQQAFQQWSNWNFFVDIQASCIAFFRISPGNVPVVVTHTVVVHDNLSFNVYKGNDLIKNDVWKCCCQRQGVIGSFQELEEIMQQINTVSLNAELSLSIDKVEVNEVISISVGQNHLASDLKSKSKSLP
jgi:hypothetical protein